MRNDINEDLDAGECDSASVLAGSIIRYIVIPDYGMAFKNTAAILNGNSVHDSVRVNHAIAPGKPAT